MDEIEVMPLRIKNVMKISKEYLSLSEEDREFFHPFPFNYFILSPILIYISISPKLINILKNIYISGIFLSSVAVNSSKEIVGFAYLRMDKKKYKNSNTANFGIFVNKNYRNKGIGVKLLKHIIKVASENNIKKIKLIVNNKNLNAINFYKRHNFIIEKVVENDEFWNNKYYTNYHMFFYQNEQQ